MLEFNCRFGDPETQAVLPRLRGDLLELFRAAREPGGLAGAAAEFADDWAVTVVLASAGYPRARSKGDVITGLDEAASPRASRSPTRAPRATRTARSSPRAAGS